MNFGIIVGYVVIRFYISAIAFGVVVLHLVSVVTNKIIPKWKGGRLVTTPT
jgi:hypothetical protein